MTRIRSAGASLRPAARAGRRGRDPRLRGGPAQPRPRPAGRAAGRRRSCATRPGSRSTPPGSARPARSTSSPTSWRRPACPPTIRATCPSSPAPRPRRPLRSTSSSAPRRSTAARGWRARAPSTPRTRRCAGSPTSPDCPRRPAACSCPAARSGNLSALVAARHTARHSALAAGSDVRPWRVAAHHGAHSSISPRCDVMDAELVTVYADDRWRLTGADLPTDPRGARPRDVLRRRRHRRHHELRHRRRPRRRWPRSARSSASGSTSTAPTAARRSRPPRRAAALRRRRAGRLVHRRPAQVAVRAVRLLRADLPRTRAGPRRAHPARRVPRRPHRRRRSWNPTDYSVGLTRRARGLPFWFSLAVHGTDAYARAIERTLDGRPVRGGGDRPARALELLRERDLSVVVFRRIGWAPPTTRRGPTGCWPRSSRSSSRRRTRGRRSTRFAIVNPATTEDDIRPSSTRCRDLPRGE